MEITIENIGLGGIFVSPNRHRKMDESLVARLAASMKDVGLINPITLTPFGNNSGYNLIAGHHRFEAAKRNGWASIPANILTGLSALEAEEVELRENLDRGELTPVEQTMHYARLKEIAEERYKLKTNPEGINQHRKEVFSQVEKKPHTSGSNTAKAVSKATGRSAPAIERDAHRVKHIPKISEAIGTTLDKGVELDALAKLPKTKQAELIDRAKAGEKVSAKTELKKEQRAEKEVALAAKQTALPNKKYGVIYADPEWKFEVYSENGLDRSAENHYPTSTTDDIAKRDVPAICADDAVLFLWATVPMIQDALCVMKEWGFTYKSQAVWVKDRIGTGYWFRNQHEILLVGTKGNIPAPAMGTQYNSVIDAPVGRHSEKPIEFRRMIEDYFPTLPKIELNAREASEGWDVWGYEAPEYDCNSA